MYIGVISMRYAKALLAYADESGTADTVYAEAGTLADSFSKVPELRQALDLYRKQKNISVGKITTVCPVAEEVVNRIRALVVEKTHGTVEFKTKTDPKLEGGFIFEIGTYRLDASVADQIKRVKQQFIAKNRRIV